MSNKYHYISEEDQRDNDNLVFQDQDDQDDDVDMGAPSPYGQYSSNYNNGNYANANTNAYNHQYSNHGNNNNNNTANDNFNGQNIQSPTPPQQQQQQLNPSSSSSTNNNNDNHNGNSDVKIRKKPGRKPGPYCPAQRKEQNRAAQRAFRDRKERHVYQLESMIKDLKTQHFLVASRLQQEIRDLKGAIQSFQSENFYLREVVFAFESALSKGNHIAILKEVKLELFQRHHQNKSQSAAAASAKASKESTPVLPSSSTTTTPASSASPNITPAAVSSASGPFSPQACMSPTASTPPYSPASSLTPSASTSSASATITTIASSYNEPKSPADRQAQQHYHEGKEPRKRSFSNMDATLTNASTATISEESTTEVSSTPEPTTASTTSSEMEGVYSMDGDILYRAPPLFILEQLTADGKLNNPTSPFASLSVPKPAYCPPGTTLPKYTEYTKHPTVFDELQSALFPPGTLESLHISMATPQEVVNDESVFGEAMEMIPQPDKKWDLEPQESKEGIARLEELGSNSDDDDDMENSKETKEALNKVASVLKINKETMPRHRLHKEFAAMANAEPPTDPRVDPKVAQMIVHQHRYNVDEVFTLLTEQAICHGPPLDKDSWQLPDPFFDRFGFLLGIELDRIRNKTWPPPPKKRSTPPSS
ncbi:hypothetical protein BGZ83_012171 [Gryganskiella cystojenkinii]|nr:hypothetical protein BGZ83_012171 [Gryganskiella cystojenkinii]